jgi:hypothetical protein
LKTVRYNLKLFHYNLNFSIVFLNFIYCRNKSVSLFFITSFNNVHIPCTCQFCLSLTVALQKRIFRGIQFSGFLNLVFGRLLGLLGRWIGPSQCLLTMQDKKIREKLLYQSVLRASLNLRFRF